MIRSTTPLPKPPAAEKDVLDPVLRIMSGRPAMTSDKIVAVVRQQHPHLAAVDIRLMLRRPYFDLEGRGWRCRWVLG